MEPEHKHLEEISMHLPFGRGNLKTLAANTSVADVMTISSGCNGFSRSSKFYAVLDRFPLIIDGVLNTATGTVIHNGATATITPLAYYNLQVATPGEKHWAGISLIQNIDDNSGNSMATLI